MDAAGRRGRFGLARRSGRTQDAADDLDLLVFDLQFHRRIFADVLFLLVFRTLLGIGMGAEWPAGAALAMEQWPIRSRGFISGVLQGSWSIGFLLSSVIWGVFGDCIGWRGMLWVGVLPALSIVYIRYFVKEPADMGREPPSAAREQSRGAGPADRDFPAGNARQHPVGVLVDGEQFRPLLLDLGIVRDASAGGSEADDDGDGGAVHDRQHHELPRHVLVGLDGRHHRPPLGDDDPGRNRDPDRAAISVHRRIRFWITIGFGLQGAFGGALYSQLPSYLSERFPTEVRATASAFCYHQGAIFGGLVAPVLAYFAVNFGLGYAIPMLVGTVSAAVSVVISLLLSPETKGKVLLSELSVA